MPIVFDDMIVGIRSNKKLSPNVTELFSRGIFYLNILLTSHTILKCLKL